MEEVNCTVPPCMNACALCRDAVQGHCAGTPDAVSAGGWQFCPPNRPPELAACQRCALLARVAPTSTSPDHELWKSRRVDKQRISD
jgi:hypothetical protein